MNLPATTSLPCVSALLRRSFFPLILAGTAPTAALWAQAAPPPTRAATAAAAEDPVIELSPFIIESSKEIGWVATQTLAGSRMKTDFKDLAQPIEVLTKDFMDDLGLNNF